MIEQKVIATNSKYNNVTLRSKRNKVYSAQIDKGLIIPDAPELAYVEWVDDSPVVIGFKEKDESSQKTLEEQRKEFNDLQGGY